MEPTPTPPSNNSFKDYIDAVKFDFPWIFARIQDVMLNPNGCWDNIKREALSYKDVLGRYLIPLAILSTVAGFIGHSVIGANIPMVGTYRMGVVDGLLLHIFSLVATIISYLVCSFIISGLAPKFGANVSKVQAIRLVAFAATPVLLAGLLSVAPSLLIGLISIFLLVYTIYLLWVGFSPMTEVAAERKVGYFITSLVASFVSFWVIMAIFATLFYPVLPTGEIKDMQEFQKNIEKLMPKNQ